MAVEELADVSKESYWGVLRLNDEGSSWHRNTSADLEDVNRSVALAEDLVCSLCSLHIDNLACLRLCSITLSPSALRSIRSIRASVRFIQNRIILAAWSTVTACRDILLQRSSRSPSRRSELCKKWSIRRNNPIMIVSFLFLLLLSRFQVHLVSTRPEKRLGQLCGLSVSQPSLLLILVAPFSRQITLSSPSFFSLVLLSFFGRSDAMKTKWETESLLIFKFEIGRSCGKMNSWGLTCGDPGCT